MQTQPFTTAIKELVKSKKLALEEFLDQEEMIWQQCAKAQWMIEGDRNTRFFHNQASKRASQNQIHGLRDEHGVLQDSAVEMGRIADQYFQSLFTSRQPAIGEIDEVVETMSTKVTPTINQELSRKFTPQEVKTALFDMFPTKSPGPDGMPALFYQKF